MSQVRTIVTLQVRRGTAAEWTSADPALFAGEIGFETDTNKFKIGIDGTTVWSDLNYANASSGGNVLDDYILTTARGSVNGVASLDADGLVPASQLPASVKITVSSVANQAARLALTAEPGDIAIQTDTGTTYALSTAPASTNGNWKELTNTAAITAAINAISTSDIEEGTNLYFTNERAEAALSSELELKAPLASPGFSGIPTADTAAPGTNNNQLATTEYTDAAIAALIDAAPEALNTLNEIAAALGDDADYAGTITSVVSDISDALSGHSGSNSAHGSVGDIVGTASEQTLSNKSISGINNTLSSIPQSAITDLGTDLGLLAPKADPTFTGTVAGITKSMVGLPNVDDTADIYKPISNDTQDALDLKADITSLGVYATLDAPAFTGIVSLPSTTSIGDTTALEIAKLHDITATAAEINTLDGITATTAELNVLDGITASTSELNILEGVTALFSEINVLDGITSTTAELNILNGVTATSAEINTLDGILASTSELNTLTGITGNVQEQLDDKANSADIAEAAQDAVGDVVGKGLVYDDATGKIEADLETAGGLKFAALTDKISADLDYLVDKTSVQTLTNKTLTSPKINEDVVVTSTATELNVLDGITATTAELNLLDGVTASTAEINILGGLTATSAELNILDGALLDTAELNFVNGVTSAIQTQLDNKQAVVANVSDTEIGYLDGVTSAIQTQLDAKLATSTASSTYQTIVSGVSDTEIGYLDGVTSAIQTQLDAKFASASASTTNITEGTNLYFTDERAQDAIGTILGTGLTYNDAGPGIGIDNAALTTYLLEGASGNSYGLIGTSVYLDVKNTNGYNKEIELDIAAVESQLDTDGFITATNENVLTNKTLTLPKINEDVVLTATATELNILEGITVTTSELNILGGVTATATEINILDGATLSTTELNYVDGVTSAIQTQIDAKAPLASPTFTGTVQAADINSSGSLSVDGSITVDGSLTVGGTTTTLFSATVATRDNLIYLNEALDLTLLGATHNGGTVEYQVADNADIVVGMDVRVTGVTPSDYNIAYSDNVTVASKRTSGNNHYFTVTKTVAVSYTSGGVAHLKADANPDLGFAGGYYSSGYAHAGFFRDASDGGKFKLFQGYTPEPDESVFIDTAHASFALAPLSISSLEATSATIGDVSNTELQYLNGVTSAIQTQLDAKLASSTASSTYALINSPTFTGTVGGITKSMVGLGNVDNTSDANKPISTATQTALDAKLASATASSTYAPLAGPTFTGTVVLPSTTSIGNVSSTELGYVDGVTSAIQTQLDTKETRYYTFVTDATTSRTIASSTDEGKTLKFTSSSAVSVTVPLASSDAGWAVGDYVELIQYGSGQITVAGAVGVTVNATDTQKKTRVQFSSMTLIKIDTNEWLLTGDTTA